MATTLTKTNSTLNESYKVTSDEFVGIANLIKNLQTDVVTNLNGQLYVKKEDGTQGDYVGNFNGMVKDGKMVYTTSQMTCEGFNKVMNLVAELENLLLKTDNA